MSRVAVAMSGGVDSSVAAGLLAEQGHDVVGITLQLWDYSSQNLAAGKGRCCSPADIADARAVAAHLGIPHYVFDHSESFAREIVEPFLDQYLNGKTPSPCITCNRRIKFDLLWRLARSLDADRLATGHYARLDVGGGPRLRKGVDDDKDQSYFLFDVPASQFDGVLLPLGGLTKTQVRSHAERLRLAIADKAESYELCFIPDGDKDAFVARHRPDEAARTVRLQSSLGDELGQRAGVHRFTVGQRKGLGLSGGKARYVLSIDGDAGTVVVGDAAGLDRSQLTARDCNWLAIAPPTAPLRALARIRHRHAEAAATIVPLPDGACEVVFDEPQRAIAAGQGVAFYDGEVLLGGGWIA